MVRLCRNLSFRMAPPHYTVSSGLCFVFWVPCLLHMSHIFDTNSQSHRGHLPSRSVRVFFPKSCSHQSAHQTYHPGFLAGPPSLGTWGEPAALSPLSHRHFAMHVSKAVFYFEGIPLSPQRLKSWALIRNLFPTGPLVPILFRFR
jgi:hypothetical protein